MSISRSRTGRQNQAIAKALDGAKGRCVCECLESRQLLAATLPTVSVTAIVPNASEDGVNGVFRVSRNVKSSQPLTITYTLAGTATPYLDYVRPTTIRIPANKTYVSVPIQAEQDNLIENTENVVFKLQSSKAYNIGSPSSATVYIADASPAVLSITPIDTHVSDAPGDTASFLITRAGNLKSDIRVDYATSGDAVAGIDYAFLGNIFIPAGQDSVLVTIHPTQDNKVELDQSIYFDLLPSTDYQLGNISTIGITLVDSSAPIVSVIASDPEAAKPNTPGSITVSRFGNTMADLPVSFTVSGSAVPGQDYRALTSIVIPAGQDSVTIPIQPLHSGVVTGDRSVTVTLSAGAGYTPGADVSGTVLIHDDQHPLLSVAAVDAVASAPGATLDPAVFRVTRFGDTQALIRLKYSFAGTALEGSDYEFVGFIYLLPGEAEHDVQIIPLDPLDPVGDRSVVFTILPDPANYGLGAPATTTATAIIHDNSAPSISVAASQPDAAEPGTNGEYTITRTGDLRSPVVLNFHMEGTATQGVNYQTIPPLVIPAGQTTITVPLVVIDDLVGGPDRTATLVLDAGASYAIGVDGSATVTIHENDGPLVLITASQPNAYEPGTSVHPGSDGEFTLTRIGDISQDLTVNFHLGGTAVAGTDYQPITSVVIPAGFESVTVAVTPIEDFTVDPLRTVTLTLDPGVGYSLDAVTNATVSIHDDSPPVVTIAATIPNATEPNVNGQYTITVTGDWTQPFLVRFHMEGTAIENMDYLGIDSILIPAPTVPNGTYQVVLPLVVLDNHLPDVGDVTATLVLDAGAGYSLSGLSTDSMATVNIQHVNTQTLLTVSAIVSEATEGATSGQWLLTRYGDLSSRLTLDLGTDFTLSGTATAGQDFFAFSRIVFSPGTSQARLSLQPLADGTIEDDETATITLLPVAGRLLDTQNSATITLYDRDIGVIANKPDAAKPFGAYPGASGELTIFRGSSAKSQAITINFSVDSKLPIDVDYNLVAVAPATISRPLNSITGTITMPAGVTEVRVQVVPRAGTPLQNDEAVSFNLEAGASYTLSPQNAGVVTIHKDGVSFVSVVASIPNAAKPDGGAAVDGEYTFTRTGDLSQPLTIKIKMSGTAVEGLDYSLGANLTFDPGQATLTLPLYPDGNLGTATQYAILTLDPGEGYSIGSDGAAGTTATITIYDRFPLVTVTASDPIAGEPNDNGAFTITRFGSLVNPLTIGYVMQGTATEGSDYDPIGTIIIPAGQSSVVVPLMVRDDGIREATQTATLFLTPSPLAAYFRDRVRSATVTITDDDPQPVINITASVPDATLGVADGQFTITIIGGQEYAYPLQFAVGGTAIPGTDYEAIQSITVLPGIQQMTVPVRALLNSNPSVDSTVILTLSPTADYSLTPPVSATVNIRTQASTYVTVEAKDPVASVSGSNPGMFLLKRTGSTALAQVVNYTLSGTAVNGVHYELINQIVIPAGQASVEVPVTAIPGIPGPALTVVLTLNAATGYVPYPGLSSATVYITSGLTVIATVTPTWEVAAPAGVFTITRGGDLTQSLVVNFTLGGTAVAGVDYVPIPTTATIPAGVDSVNVRIFGVRDDTIDGVKTVTLTLLPSGGLTPDAPLNTAAVEIIDAAQVSVIAYTNVASESGSPGIFTFQRTGDTTGSLEIRYALSGTAVEGDDYRAIGRIVIPAGYGSFDVPVYAFSNGYSGTSPTITLTILRTPDVVPYPQASATITILEDVPVLSVAAVTPTAVEGGAPGIFRFTRIGNLTQPVEVTYTITGSAGLGSDYQALGRIIIPAGLSTLDVELFALSDDLQEAAETVTIQIIKSSVMVVGSPSSATITITDATPPLISAQALDRYAVEEGPTPGLIVINRLGNTDEALELYYTLGGTAIAGVDYQSPGRIVFPAGQTQLILPLIPIDDLAAEPPEFIEFSLMPGPSYVLSERYQATIEIIDNDLPSVHLVGNDLVGKENQDPADNAMLTIWRDGDLSQPMTVTIALGGTGVPGWLISLNPLLIWDPTGNGVDYGVPNLVIGTNQFQVVIPQEMSYVQIPVGIEDNVLPDGTRTAIFTLMPVAGGYVTVAGEDTATVTILDDEAPRLSVAAPIHIATEAGRNPGIFTITRQGSLDLPVTVNYTLGGTAIKGTDYLNPGTIVIPAGAAFIDVPIVPIDDLISEGAETVIVTLQASPTAAYSLDPLSANTQATITIADNDPVVLTVTGSQPNASESGVQGRLTFTRNGNVTNDLPISYSLSGTAVSGTDYQALGNLVIPAGQASLTVPVIAIDDGIIEAIETVVLTIQPSAGNYVIGSSAAATVNIIDNDDNAAPTISAFTRPKIVAGAGSPTFTVTYLDQSLVDMASLGNGNLLIVGPKAYRQFAVFVSASANAGAQTVTATYRIITPGAAWDSADNGTYTIYVQPNQVKDIYGNAMATQMVGTFSVNLAAKKAAPRKTTLFSSRQISPVLA